jgi:hypothetical protein
MLKQSHVTYVSLALTTFFRASLVSSATISFTQYLWKLLRQNLFRISLIERLFQIRHNPIILLDTRVLRRAPILFTIALLLWLTPLATIYPPGALTVISRPYTFTETFNLSAVNALVPENFYPPQATIAEALEFLEFPSLVATNMAANNTDSQFFYG